MTAGDMRRHPTALAGLCQAVAVPVGVVLFLLVLAAIAPSAGAAGYVPLGYVAGAGLTYTENFGLDEARVAVEDSTGNVFVATGGNLVKVYAPVDSAGRYGFVTQFGRGSVSSAFGIAVDQTTGSVYVVDATGGRIVKFISDGATRPTFTVDGSFTSPASGGAPGEIGSFRSRLAVDPTSGDLLVADSGNDRISRFESGGTFEASFDGSTAPGGAFTGVVDLAVAPDGDTVVTDTAGDSFSDIIAGASTRVERFGPTGAHEATIGPVDGGAGALAVDPNTGHVLVAGDMASWVGGVAPRIYVFDPDGTPVTRAALVDRPGVDGFIESLAVKSGADSRLYVTTGNRSGFALAQVAAYGPTPAAPGVQATAVTDKGTSTGRLTGKVNPLGLPTSFRFEYGTDTGYGSSTPAMSAGSGSSAKVVGRTVEGLGPGTTYHYRLVAENAAGTTTSADRTFHTLAKPPVTRRYELVSPPDKNSNDISFRTSRSRGAISGDIATFTSTGAFAGAQGVGKVVQYLAERDPDAGWRTRAIMPAIKTTSATLNFAPMFRDFSPDLGKGLIITADPQPVASAPSGTWNLYVRDNESNGWSLVTTAAPSGAGLDYRPRYAGASDDLSHVVFESDGALTPDAPDDGLSKVYEWADGELRLVSVVHGSPTSSGAIAGGGADAGTGIGASTRRTVSADGSRIVFTASPTFGEGQLYLRIDGNRTQHVNASERTTPDSARPALFQSASRDGSRVFFTTAEQLVDADGDATNDLYMYTETAEPETDENLALISRDDEPGDPGGSRTLGVLGASDDGRHVYFAAQGALVSPALVGFRGGNRLYHWHDGQIYYVGPLADAGAPESSADGFAQGQKLWDQFYNGGKASRVTPDGRHIVYTSYRASASLQFTYPFPGGLIHRDVYMYSAGEGQARCISCNPRGYEPPLGIPGADHVGTSPETEGSTLYQGTGAGLASTATDYENRAISEDGRWVFFSSDQALVSSDANGRVDAYVYDTLNDHLRLLSSGASRDDSYFLDASSDGRDAFFVTRERLVGWDVDDNADLYDARVGGGLPEPDPQRPPCDGDACQGYSDDGPEPSRPGSRSSRGAGNAAPAVPATFSLHRIGTAQLARLARRGRLAVRVTVDRPGVVTATARTASRRVIARGAKRVARTGTVRLVLRLSGSAQRRLARGGELRARLSVRFTGTRLVRRQTLRLRSSQLPRKGGRR